MAESLAGDHSFAPQDVFVLAGTDADPNQLEGNWPDRRYYSVGRPELHYFPSHHTARAKAMIYPGGGYVDLVHDKEGIETAIWLNALGLDAYIVTHRLPGTKQAASDEVFPFDIALSDSLACLEFVKRRDTLPLFHVGMSSGGHLAGVMACHDYPSSAAGALIAYAPLNANHRQYKVPPGKPDYPPPEKQAFYDAWPIGIEAEPHGLPGIPCFLVYALHDQPVPIDHALNFVKAMQRVGGDVEAHIFPDAPHGFALRDLNGTHDQWPSLAARWIERVLKKGLERAD